MYMNPYHAIYAFLYSIQKRKCKNKHKHQHQHHRPAQIFVSDDGLAISEKGHADVTDGITLLAILERSSSLELADALLSPRIFFSPM